MTGPDPGDPAAPSDRAAAPDSTAPSDRAAPSDPAAGDPPTGTGPDPPTDPAADPRANYDYVDAGSEPAAGKRADLAAALRDRVDGAVRFDDYSRSLYATDASAYEVTPVGVVFPTDTADVSAVVETCAERGVAVLPRGGGTSLAGQTVNEAVVLDFTRHMDAVLSVDPDGRTARAQPGTTLGDLNAALEDHGLKFAPDPAWGDRSALGGAIGNNSTGAHSLQYGKTDAYVESCEVVLADGTVATLGETDLGTLRDRADPEGSILDRAAAAVLAVVEDHAGAVEDAYPPLKRNVSGYNLDVLVEEAESGSVNLARLLAGSEGTLAVVTEATVSLEPVPGTKAMALLSYDGLAAAMEDVAPILDHDPAALEVLDDVLLDLAADRPEFADLVGMLPEGTDAVLLVEFYADSDREGRRRVADLLADRCPVADPVGDPTTADTHPGDAPGTDDPVRAVAAMEAHDAADRERFWKLRKSGLPILLSRTTDDKHVSFVEDTAVPPDRLPEYVREFRAILDDHDTYASFYAHAGPGVLHVRPLVNTKTGEGVERMASIAEAVTDLVVEYGGSVSGEHGDGRARTGFNRKLYGDAVVDLFRDVKTAFDPDWILNPGQVCGDVALTENLRFDPDYEFDAGFDPDLEWDNDNGLQGMVELCHGCGGCRGGQETTGGVMCPTYRAVDEEGLSTRGRANALRRAMSGEFPDGVGDPATGGTPGAGDPGAGDPGAGDPGAGGDPQFDEEFLDEVLELCIGCKGCRHDCPSGVDLAKLKAELTHQAHERREPSLRDKLFADVDALARLGSALAPVSNWLAAAPGTGRLREAAGIARERRLPTFERESLTDWWNGRGSRVTHDAAERKVALFPDTYTNYVHPGSGRAAVRVLEAAGIRVEVPDGTAPSGRAAHSKGFLDRARDRARENVRTLAPLVDRGYDVVCVEPSEAVMVQLDYRDLLSGPAVERVADSTYGVAEYVDEFDLLSGVSTAGAGRLVYHGHCHQKATGRAAHAPAVLRAAGYEVEALDSGCCGMAGSFGYEREHYSMSRAIYSVLDDGLRAALGERGPGAAGADDPAAEPVAPGTSCRAQIEDFGDWGEPAHPIEQVAAALER